MTIPEIIGVLEFAILRGKNNHPWIINVEVLETIKEELQQRKPVKRKRGKRK